MSLRTCEVCSALMATKTRKLTSWKKCGRRSCWANLNRDSQTTTGISLIMPTHMVLIPIIWWITLCLPVTTITHITMGAIIIWETLNTHRGSTICILKEWESKEAIRCTKSVPLQVQRSPQYPTITRTKAVCCRTWEKETFRRPTTITQWKKKNKRIIPIQSLIQGPINVLNVIMTIIMMG